MHGPFEIVHAATMLPRHSMRSWRDALVASYEPMWSVSVNWHGQQVIAGGDKVLVLTDAPQPALIVAGGQSNHLVTEEAGQPVKRKFPKDGYRVRPPIVQWLDAVNGQPGEQIQLYTSSANRHDSLQFAGGRLLLLNDGVVLDVQTLQSWQLDFFANRAVLDEFRAGSANEARAYLLSPGRSQIVFVGSRPRQTGGDFEYALLVAEMASNRMYLVPFGPDLVRFDLLKDPTPAWLARHFFWGRDEAGREHLQPLSPMAK